MIDKPINEKRIFKYGILPNKMKYVIIQDKEDEFAQVSIAVKAGSLDEPHEYMGLAHFLEHIMFKSTTKRPNKTLLKSLDNLGTYYNAGTSRDCTYYEINGNKNDIDEIIDIILDLYSNPKYEKDEIELEKGVIMEEYKMYLENTSRILYDSIISEIFKNTPLEKLIIGTEQNILNMTIDQISEFRKLYTTNNSLLVITGNFEKNKIINIIKKSMNSYTFNTSNHNEPNIKYNIIKKKPNITIIPNEKNSQSYIFICFYFDTISFYEECILKFLCDYLSSGSTSKLFDALRNKLGASYSNESDYSIFSEKNGIFNIVCNVNNLKILEVIREIFIIIKDLKKNLITNEEISKVKKIFETGNLFQIKK
jgi:predicted Zn-dependent peptidase